MSNVDNFLSQAGSGKDNVLVLGGTVISPGGTSVKASRLTATIADVSTADSFWLYPGFAGTITKVSAVLQGATLTGGAAAITLEIGGTGVTGGDITLAVSSADGDVFTATPSALNIFTSGEPIEIITDGGSTGTAALHLTFELEAS